MEKDVSARIATKSPSDCSQDELEAFITLAAKGEQVEAQAIRVGASRAESLLWIGDREGLNGVAAVKIPFRSYRDDVFLKAGASDLAKEFRLELGYVCVDEKKRKKGTGAKLVSEAMNLIGGRSVFATNARRQRRHEKAAREKRVWGLWI